MKLAIVTFTYGNNYGQRLQNLAMQELFSENNIICYTLKEYTFRDTLEYKLKKKIKYIFNFQNERIEYKRDMNFKQFDSQYISYYNKTIKNGNVDENIIEDFDFFIAGSDQIWSPYLKESSSYFFLTFCPKDKRLTYAPSFSVDNIPENREDQFKEYLQGFSNISVREFKGAEFIKNLTGKDATVVVDPTLMFDAYFWRKFSNKLNDLPNDYILIYSLGNNIEYGEVIDNYIRKNNCKIVNIMKDDYYYSLGPSEFLYLIDNAKLVLTDSYHGTIFSMIFHTPFVICERKGSSICMNSRFDTLYKKLNVFNRHITNITDENLLTVNFDNIDTALEKERKDARDYISGILIK